jgi:hypothetical protein
MFVRRVILGSCADQTWVICVYRGRFLWCQMRQRGESCPVPPAASDHFWRARSEARTLIITPHSARSEGVLNGGHRVCLSDYGRRHAHVFPLQFADGRGDASRVAVFFVARDASRTVVRFAAATLRVGIQRGTSWGRARSDLGARSFGGRVACGAAVAATLEAALSRAAHCDFDHNGDGPASGARAIGLGRRDILFSARLARPGAARAGGGAAGDGGDRRDRNLAEFSCAPRASVACRSLS